MPCGSGKDNSKSGENGHCGFQDLDHSILQHSLTLGVNNVKQIMMSVKNGTREVKDILLNECNVIYECKVCANLFRSLANFLYHKRCYCKKHLCEDMQLFDNFEESTSTVVVHPEASEESPFPQMRECTVELEKADVAKEKCLLAAQSSCSKEAVQKEKPGRKSGRGRELAEEEGKKSKASGKESKSRSNSPVPEENTKETEDNGKRGRSEKASAGKDLTKTRSESPMISRRTREKNKRVAKTRMSAEPPKKAAKVSKNDSVKGSDSDDSAKGNAYNAKNKTHNVKGNMEAVKASPPNVKSNGKANIKGKNGIQNDSEDAKCTSTEKTSPSLKTTSPAGTSIPSSNASTLDDSMQNEDSIEIITDENNDETLKTSNIKVTSLMNVKDANKAGESAANICSPSKMLLKPVKKIILANPKTLNLKNGSVFESIQSKIKANKIGFTKIANTAQCFPKIIFKTLDGNPHAVFQATEGDKSENISVKSKPEVAPSTSDCEKGVYSTEKDATSSTPTTPEKEEIQPLSPPSVEKAPRVRPEFHVTRRKRLLSRSDCNVAELKCLICRTSFTSIKTLYFHMLSLHSKKRQYYPCPFCRQFFVQMYGVTRHLISIHNKSKEQINKLRDVIKKKSIWKKVDDSGDSPREDDKPRPRSTPFKELEIETETVPEPEEEIVIEPSTSTIETPIPKTPPKASKNSALHQCSKCNRAFERKSSQVSHEKFCIMNAIKVETVDLAGNSPISPPPNVSFLSLSPKAASVEPQFQRTIKSEPLDPKSNARPKRGAEKQMHKDFVNSQTLKWRSANRVGTKAMTGGVKKGPLKNLEKKVLNIMNVDNLLCTKCDKTFSSYSNLRRHVAIHVGWTRFKCKFCEYQAYNKSQCWAHLQKAHGVSDAELDKGVENLSNTPSKKGLPNVLNPKQLFEVRPKQMSVRTFQMSKTKIGKKKGMKKQTAKKGTTEDPKKEKGPPEKKTNLDEKKDKAVVIEKSKGSLEVKKDKGQINEGKKKDKSPNAEGTELRKEKSQTTESKRESLKEKVSLNKMEVIELSKEKSPLTPIIKYNVPGVRKDGSNYKSVTTNNPTTIILSKKLPSPTTATVQSILTLSPESMSSNATVKTIFPLRSSPRKVESKSPEEKSLASLVTRSGTYTKTSLPPLRSNSMEEQQKKPTPVFPDKTYAKKDRLISEWYPKKDLNSNSSRRESAPLIIGLVPASSDGLAGRAKNPAISYERERSNC